MRGVLAALCAVILPAVAAATAVPTIPDVRTLNDLRRLPAVPTDFGFDVRVGLADAGPTAGPVRLIYCLATPRPGPPTTRPTGHVGTYGLGPLDVDVTAGVTRRVEEFKLPDDVPGDAERLCCQALPIGWADGVDVRVLDGTALLLQRHFAASDHREPCWGTSAAEPPVMHVKRDHGKADPGSALEPTPWAAYAEFPRFASLLRSPSPPDRSGPPPGDAPLPGGDELPPAWAHFYFPSPRDGRPLSLTLDHDRFVVTPGDAIATNGDLNDHLLARWWVNNRPLAMPDHQGPWFMRASQKASMLESPSSEPRAVTFGLPAMLGPLKIGDVVGLQLLWVDHVVPAGRDRLVSQPVARLMRLKQIAIPVPTNRLDVTLDARLLKLAGR